MSFKNETASDKIEKLEKDLNNIDNDSTEFKRNLVRDNDDVKDKINHLEQNYKNELYKLKTCKDLLNSKNEAIQNIEIKFDIEVTKLYDERDSITNENRK